ncbi:MAG: hypothetical protein JOZ75_10660 [Candidatus Dormibacteraeota bacterium]|nr:hypothetical protein [Candidatus Dormibacteraeota bacterium]
MFSGNSIPVIGLGALSQLTRPLTATVVFAALVAALSLAALAWRLRETPGSSFVSEVPR